MAKASSFQWRLLINLIQTAPLPDLAIELRRMPIQRWSQSSGWLLLTLGSVALLYWNGRLVLATGAGVAIMMLIYVMHDWKLDLPLANVRKFLSGWNQPVSLAIGGGGLAALTTYLAASVWLESDSHWVASGAILQGVGTLAVLLLLVWQQVSRQTERKQQNLQRAISDLTHEDALQRLIAVRQLITTVPDMRDNPLQRRTIVDCFRLLISREEDPIVREAVMDGLQMIDRAQPLKPATQPALKMTAIKRSAVRQEVIHRS
ncbi:hypothetical protein H6F43_17595 [Leptolyngbya sp. FACHB-36]|uniref:hypothetical protein n=1 Tax=Leptolyngbya sp. FACHB-36 TaxID=2692808 RepID=UPI0016812434|nr:hypothetical protein [Leptolyngbya sp. FACHB-36]MBD2021996.1 hypothetical protein [Leptolyngbya sp. FACHB-36]